MTNVEKALEAYAYHYPRKRSHGMGQAATTLSCGHVGPVGAPCCKSCGDKMIDEALASMKNKNELPPFQQRPRS